MNAFAKTLTTTILLAVATLDVASAQTTDARQPCPSVSHLQVRIVEHADQGMSQLTSFVHMTHLIYGIDMTEVRASLETWRAAAACQVEAAAKADRPDDANLNTTVTQR